MRGRPKRSQCEAEEVAVRGRAPNRRAMEAAAPLLTGDCRRSHLARAGLVGGRIRWARRMAVLPAAATVCATPRRAPVHLLPRPPASSLSISFEVDASATVTYRAARTP